jgi:hypothetical protein
MKTLRSSFLLALYALFFFSFAATGAGSDSLMLKAYETHTRAMAISCKGKIIQESYFKLAPDPVEAGAGYRMLLAAAYGRLIEDKLLNSLEETVASFLSSWNQSLKKQVKLSHLLDGSSGLLYDSEDPDEKQPRDAYRFAEAAIIVSMPGLAYQPNPKELWLLSAILKQVSGMDPEQYFIQKILVPLEIKEYQFKKDASGNVIGIEVVAGQWIHLAEMFVSAGKYKDNQIVSSAFCKKLFSPQSETGQSELGAELIYDTTFVVLDDEFIDQLSSAGLSGELISGFKKIKGRYPGIKIPAKVWEKAFGADYEQLLYQQVFPVWPTPYKVIHKGRCRGAIFYGPSGEHFYLDQKSGCCAIRLPYPSENRASMKDLWTEFPMDVIKYQ